MLNFVITESFFIKSRGLVLVLSYEKDADPPIRVKLGDEVELICQDGERFRTQVKGLEICDPRPMGETLQGFLVSLTAEYGLRLRGAKAQFINNA
jgi:hypothetical protein